MASHFLLFLFVHFKYIGTFVCRCTLYLIIKRVDMVSLWQIVATIAVLASIGLVQCQSISRLAPECFNTTTCPCCSVSCPSYGSGQCEGKCIDGYHGGKCYSECPSNCIRCVDAQQGGGVSNCTLCKDGYYSTASLYQCQSACSSNCKTCESSASRCTSCHKGFYLTESYLCAECNKTCSACNTFSSCTSCGIGYYLDSTDGTCHTCNPLCFDCNSSQSCFCSNGCIVGSLFYIGCNTETNECPFGCKRHFNSSDRRGTCDICSHGMYGINCDLQCNLKCATSNCRRLDGHCYECIDGFFGDNCDMQCPENCRSGCNKISGKCLFCKDGFFDSKCLLECGKNCIRCTMTNGTCITCIDGYFGNTCTETCPENCLNGICDTANGSCVCEPGYIGSKCEVRISTNSTEGIGPPLVVTAAPQNYVGATVGLTLAAVVIFAGLVGLGVWFLRRRCKGTNTRNPFVFAIATTLSDIEKLEKERSRIDTRLSKWSARRSEINAKIEALKVDIPYHNSDRADKIEDMSYEMLQKENNEAPYSTI